MHYLSRLWIFYGNTYGKELEGDYFFYIIVSISVLAIIFSTFVIRQCVIKYHARYERKAELKKSKARCIPYRSNVSKTCEISVLNSVRNDQPRLLFLSEVSDNSKIGKFYKVI